MAGRGEGGSPPEPTGAPGPRTTGRSPGALRRELGTLDATLIGVGSMIGAGVYVAWAPAARAAGGGLLLALGLAAALAFCNATASAQLAAVHPQAGGTYVYAGLRLGRTWGFLAGWSFVVGKTASCVVMAQAVARSVAPGSRVAQALVEVALVAAVTAANYRGITRTARATRWLLAATLVVLMVVVGAVLTGSRNPVAVDLVPASTGGLLEATGVLFFAFAGYARIATLGEEVRDPRRTIARAVQAALAATFVIYLVLAVALLQAVPVAALASSQSPLRTALEMTGRTSLEPLVGLGAALAATGALLALMAGIGRTTLAMARDGELPRALSAVHLRNAVPHRAELLLGLVVALLAVAVPLRSALGFSSFGVLLYYALANASALTQRAGERRWPRPLHLAGLIGCVVVAVSLPLASVLTGVAVLAVGLAGRSLHRARVRGGAGAG